MKRLGIAALLSFLILSGCGSKSDQPTVSQSPNGCTEKTARDLRQDFITKSAFDVTCVKVLVNTQFFFINNDDETHTATTQDGAPESFDAELPKKNSTYAHSFTKTGKYEIKCKRHQESMTLFVF